MILSYKNINTETLLHKSFAASSRFDIPNLFWSLAALSKCFLTNEVEELKNFPSTSYKLTCIKNELNSGEILHWERGCSEQKKFFPAAYALVCPLVSLFGSY